MMIPLALLLLAAHDPLLPTDAERARLDAGEVLVDIGLPGLSGTPANRVRAVINAPPEKVWPLVWDCGRFEKTMPSIAKSELVEKNGNTTVCRVAADLPMPLPDLVSLAKATHTVEPGVRWQREWKLIEGDYEVNQGSFTLLPWADGKTLAIYRIEAKPKIPVPEWMMRKAQADRLPELMHRLRKQAGSP